MLRALEAKLWKCGSLKYDLKGKMSLSETLISKEDKHCRGEGNVTAQCWSFELRVTSSSKDEDTCLPYPPLLLSTCVISARDFTLFLLSLSLICSLFVNILIKQADYSLSLCLEGVCPEYKVRLA